MPLTKLCHSFLEKSLSFIHQYRRNALMDVLDALLNGASLTLSNIGRNMSTRTTEKHNIKRVDRLLNNERLHQEIETIYQVIIDKLTAPYAHCVILVDWSACQDSRYYQLRASLAYKGRSIPLMSLVAPEEELGTQTRHEEFLQKLYNTSLKNKRVTLVTDAGFKAPWFASVQALGWDFIGRVKGTCQIKITDDWQRLEDIYQQSTSEAVTLGKGCLNKTINQITGYFHLINLPPKGRKSTKIMGTQIEANYKTSAKSPWLLFTSLDKMSAKHVVSLYHKRMQIEQNFRDEKSVRYGMGFRLSGSRHIQRLAVLILLAILATIILWIIGLEAEKRHFHRHFQANSLKASRVLSYIFLAKRLIKQKLNVVDKKFIKRAFMTCLRGYNKMILL